MSAEFVAAVPFAFLAVAAAGTLAPLASWAIEAAARRVMPDPELGRRE